MTLWYVGNGAYCYANSVSMALQAQGDEVDPGYVECLTAFAISAQWVDTPRGRLPYKMGPYSMWGRFERQYEPTPEECFHATDRQIREQLLLERERVEAESVGAPMIRQLAAEAAQELPPAVRGHLAYFAFPVSARHCEDFARFFAPYAPRRSALKSAQARCFGQAQAQLMAKDHAGLSLTLG